MTPIRPRHDTRRGLTGPLAVAALALFACAAPCRGEGPVNSIEAGATLENLDGGFEDWESVNVVASHRFATRQVLYGEARESDRFAERDRQFTTGYYHPLDDKTTALIEIAVSPEHHFTPEWTALVQTERQLGAGYGLQVGWRHGEYSATATDLITLTFERYWGAYRIAYTHYLGKPEGVGFAASGRLQFDYFYADRSAAGIVLFQGKEVENVGRVITTDVRGVALTARHWLSAAWAIAFDAWRHEQGDLYVRTGVRLGLRHDF
jgi:YaiO family outer membrane protein